MPFCAFRLNIKASAVYIQPNSSHISAKCCSHKSLQLGPRWGPH